jgi:hypothetical protein
MTFLAQLLAIDLLNHAILDNHCHIILRTRPDVVKKMRAEEVARRWNLLCPPRRIKKGKVYEPSEADINVIINDAVKLETIRQRLSSLSWFMKLLVEPLARIANKEDGCRGHFWESRFSSVKLTDEASLLACAVYVDLNPIRAAMAESLEESEHTSVKIRIDAIRRRKNDPHLDSDTLPDSWLSPVYLDPHNPAADHVEAGHARCSDRGFLPIPFEQYINILEWTAAQLRSDKRGSMPLDMLNTLQRLGIENQENWFTLAQEFGRCFAVFAGCEATRRCEAARMGRRRYRRGREALISNPA